MCILFIIYFLGCIIFILSTIQYFDEYRRFLNRNNNISTNSKLNQKKEINNNISINSKLNQNNEINNLKEELIKKDKIIEQQKYKIIELENKLKSNNINLSKIQSLESLIKEKDKEINELNRLLEKNNINTNKGYDKCVNFISQDYKINYAIPCSGNSVFAQVEELLYQEYPEYRETNNIFLANGKPILRFKTINENNVGTGKPITLIIPPEI